MTFKPIGKSEETDSLLNMTYKISNPSTALEWHFRQKDPTVPSASSAGPGVSSPWLGQPYFLSRSSEQFPPRQIARPGLRDQRLQPALWLGSWRRRRSSCSCTMRRDGAGVGGRPGSEQLRPVGEARGHQSAEPTRHTGRLGGLLRYVTRRALGSDGWSPKLGRDGGRSEAVGPDAVQFQPGARSDSEEGQGGSIFS